MEKRKTFLALPSQTDLRSASLQNLTVKLQRIRLNWLSLDRAALSPFLTTSQPRERNLKNITAETASRTLNQFINMFQKDIRGCNNKYQMVISSFRIQVSNENDLEDQVLRERRVHQTLSWTACIGTLTTSWLVWESLSRHMQIKLEL